MQEIFLQTLSISSASTSTIHRHNWLTDNIQWLYSLLLLFLQHIYYFVWCCRDDKDSTEWNEKCWSLYFILFLWNIHFIIKKRMREWNVYEKWDGMVGFHIIIIIKIIFVIFCTCILFFEIYFASIYPSFIPITTRRHLFVSCKVYIWNKAKAFEGEISIFAAFQKSSLTSTECNGRTKRERRRRKNEVRRSYWFSFTVFTLLLVFHIEI